MASDFNLDRFCKEITNLKTYKNNQKEEKEIQHLALIPRLTNLREKKDTFEGTAYQKIAGLYPTKQM